MLQNTFLFLPGIGKKSEEDLWVNDIIDWDQLILSLDRKYTSKTRQDIFRDHLFSAQEALRKRDVSYFAERIPQNQYWRLYKDFLDTTVFLDIETTGLSTYYDVITVIGTYDGKNTELFVKDNNLEEIQDYLEQFEILVTFNGKLFDVPFIQRTFPKIRIPPVHIDLRFLLKSIGISGPLKVVEKKMNIARDADITDIDGREAAVLWSRFVKGDDDALRDLIAYNISDTVNLKKLMDICYATKIKREILPKLQNTTIQQTLFGPSRREHLGGYQPKTEIVNPDVAINSKGTALEIFCNNKRLLSIQRKRIQKTEIKITNLLGRIESHDRKPLCVGIDLTGSERRASGVCVLSGKHVDLRLIKSDEDIIRTVERAEPEIISIDSPLSLPEGRCCVSDDCGCRQFGIMRECERILKRRGINVYPCLIQSMQRLTQRGIYLTETFEDAGYEVIESYPGAAQDILRFPRKRIDLRELESDLMDMGVTPHCDRDPITHDQIDALTSALVGYFFLAKQYEAIGNVEEGYLIIPDLERSDVK